MTLDAGTRLGPYDVLHRLGADGMGEVYRARDTTLDRDVAIKILPELFAADRDRLAVPLFSAHVGVVVRGGSAQQYVVSPDGQRFLINRVTEEAASPITVI